MALPEDFVAQVIEHMNSDHRDSLCEYAMAYGDAGQVDAATLTGLSVNSMTLECDLGGELRIIEIPLISRIDKPGQIRGVLVAMAKQARALNQKKS